MLEDLRTDRVKALDASAVEQDDFNHARESFTGLKQLARRTLNPKRSTDAERKAKARLKDPYRRAKRVNASVPKASRYVTDQLESAGLWLQSHRDDIGIPEIEREDGRLNSQRREINESNYGMEVCDIDNPNPSNYEAAGQLYVGDRTCYAPLESVARDLNIYWDGSHGVRNRCLQARGERLRGYFDRRAPSLRWRGMEEWDAVAKADAKLEEGLRRTRVKSGAKPLPPIARLHELFEVRGSDLINRRLKRTVTARQVKVDGDFYLTSRIAYAVASGADPSDKVVKDGNATFYRNAKGWATERGDHQWDARVQVGPDDITVGVYSSKDQAEKACKIYLKALAWS